MHRGYYKTYRKITESRSWSRGLAYRGLMHSILVRVNHKPLPFRGEVIAAGSFAVVISAWAEDLQISRQQLQRMLKKLDKESDNFINIENVGNRFTIIKVVNWATYQHDARSSRATDDATNEQPACKPRATNEQQNKNNKNNKNERITFSSDSDEVRLSELLLSFILGRNPKHRTPNIQTWAAHIDRMLRLDKRTPEEIEKVIRWSQADSFWQNNILSTEKLRKQFDSLWLKMKPTGRQGAAYEPSGDNGQAWPEPDQIRWLKDHNGNDDQDMPQSRTVHG